MSKPPSYNVLFVCADDLRPKSMGCYGDGFAVTPNFDRLAAQGMVFERAYCHQPLCAPSRASLMTGRRLDGSNALVNTADYRVNLPDVVTIPQLFREHGAHCVSFGKVNHLHPYVLDPLSWSEPEQVYDIKKRDEYLRPENRVRGFIKPMSYGTATEWIETPDDGYQDGQAVTAAIEKLREIKGERFFMGVGFKRPHLPFTAPKKYWDLYDPKKIPLVAVKELPASAEGKTWRYLPNKVEFQHYTDVPNEGPIPDDVATTLRHGYYACASYIDAQLGRLLDELEKLDLAQSTIVVFWADHGMHLGEGGLWGKKMNTELSTHVPLLLSVPGKTQPGSRTKALVDLVDLYPTLAELAGLTTPEGLEGISLVPLLSDPDRPWKKAAISQCQDTGREIWGYTVRADKYRYVEWFPCDERDNIIDRELYLIEEDPDATNNLADHTEYQELMDELAAIVRTKDGWKKALP